jgi:MOSC domain
MPGLTGTVTSVATGRKDHFEKDACQSIALELDGIVGDRHRGYTREAWPGDKQPEGTVRRNERQWSATSIEELAAISEAMGLAKPLQAGDVAVNLCFEGIADLSRLPRGTVLKFSSGAVLMVEEYNPPCSDMGARLAQVVKTRSGEPLADTAFSQAAKFCRGLVGTVEVAGNIAVGDDIIVEPEHLPKWLRDS